MATFKLNDRLPDPTFSINNGGGVGGALDQRGPGFASAKVSSNDDNQVSRTVSNRVLTRGNSSHRWDISIAYNPMLRDDFDIVDAFLQQRGARKRPFYVVLPQYSKPKDPDFVTFMAGRTLVAPLATAAGSPKLTVANTANAVFTSTLKFGDFINISDPADRNHVKAYKVIGVETPDLHEEGTMTPASTHIRLRLQPPLTRFVTAGAQIIINDPKFRVIQKGDVIEHDLNNDGLFQFGLQLEEALV